MLAALASGVVGCQGRPTSAQATAPQAAPAEPTPPAAEPTSAEPEAKPPEPPAEPIPEPAPQRLEPKQRLEPEQWLTSHEVSAPTAAAFVKTHIRVVPEWEYACESVAVGSDELLDCRVFRLVDQGEMTRVTYDRVLVSLSKAKPTLALKLTTTIEVMDKEDLSQPPLLDLALRYAEGGTTLAVDDATPDTGCDRAISRAREVERSAVKAWGSFDLKLMRAACAARGVYRFQAGRFVRGVGPKRGAAGTSGP